MKKYKVYGTYTITIAKEVWAHGECEAIDKAASTFGGVIEYVGNGGYDKLVGVSGYDESVAADGYEEWGNNVEEIEEDPDYNECPQCGATMARENGDFWYCEDCDAWFDADGYEVGPPDDEE